MVWGFTLELSDTGSNVWAFTLGFSDVGPYHPSQQLWQSHCSYFVVPVKVLGKLRESP
jgi:hypothetical protein